MSKYSVRLTQKQRKMMEDLVKKGEAPARKIMHAQILLKSDKGEDGPGWSYKQIQDALGIGETVIKRVRKRFVENGMEDALERKKQPVRPELRKLDGEQEAMLIATLCTEKPGGQERWTLRALANRLVELEVVEHISHETVRSVMKKNKLKPWLKEYWCIGPTGDEKYVYHMEDVLDVYTRQYNPEEPQICLDEGSLQLVSEEREPIEMGVDRVKKIDYEYNREGFCSIFLTIEPLTGKIVTQVKERRTKKDFAHFVKYLIDEAYPNAKKLVIVMDNLNTHTPASLYHVFPPKEARRLTKKLEIHYTPVHGSWLNMAEIGLSVLGRQALGERFKSITCVRERIAAWQAYREKHPPVIDWRFTTEKARIKLKRLYPLIEESQEEVKTAP